MRLLRRLGLRQQRQQLEQVVERVQVGQRVGAGLLRGSRQELVQARQKACVHMMKALVVLRMCLLACLPGWLAACLCR